MKEFFGKFLIEKKEIIKVIFGGWTDDITYKKNSSHPAIIYSPIKNYQFFVPHA